MWHVVHVVAETQTERRETFLGQCRRWHASLLDTSTVNIVARIKQLFFFVLTTFLKIKLLRLPNILCSNKHVLKLRNDNEIILDKFT